MKADLHVHSTASDGTLAPRDLVRRAHTNGVSVLAIADHDTVNGLAEARRMADSLGVTLINAVEFSSVAEGCDVHVLGYFVDPADAGLASLLDGLRAARQERAAAMVDALSRAGYNVSIEDVSAISAGGSVGRSHIARALVGAGHAESVAAAFQMLIGRGRPFYLPKRGASPAEVIGTIRELGALPVLAHPGVTAVDGLIPSLADAGLMGIEAYHADHTAEQTVRYAAMGAELDLLVTGGSDFHGPYAPNPDIGSVEIPAAAVRALLSAGEGLGT